MILLRRDKDDEGSSSKDSASQSEEKIECEETEASCFVKFVNV